MRERDLDRMFVRECKRRGVVTYKTSSVGARGFADRTLVGPGRRLGFVELKARGGKLTRHQETFFNTVYDTSVFLWLLEAGRTRGESAERIKECLDTYFRREFYHPSYVPL